MESLAQIFANHQAMSPLLLWTSFGIAVVLLLAADLFWFNRKMRSRIFGTRYGFAWPMWRRRCCLACL